MANSSILWNPKKLKELYVEKQLPVEEIADRADCSNNTLYRWLDHHGIEQRSPRENHAKFRTSMHGYEVWQGVAPEKGDSGVDVRVHRLLMYLEHDLDELAGKDVHHKNGIKWDNRLENLELLTRSEHLKLHENIRNGEKQLTGME